MIKDKILFLDRDGTINFETEDEQIDSFEKLTFLPKVFNALYKIQHELDYKFVMVTNQDGLGTDSFPENTFWPVQKFIVNTLESEGITFDKICIDRSFPKENLPTRKPRTGLVESYRNDYLDLDKSFVIGDRNTDIELAKNMNIRGILIRDNNENCSPFECQALQTTDWEEIYQFLKSNGKKVQIKRKTKETDIDIELNITGTGQSNIKTGLGFFDHMLEQIAKHSQVDLNINVKGDLEIDEHHTIEDTALALGQAFSEALGKNRKGIQRYGFTLPMDECEAAASIDLGGRNYLVWKVKFKREYVGDVPTEMFEHFFKSFTDTAKCTLHLKSKGKNDHHKIEGLFKAFAKTLKQAIAESSLKDQIPSTKGVI